MASESKNLYRIHSVLKCCLLFSLSNRLRFFRRFSQEQNYRKYFYSSHLKKETKTTINDALFSINETNQYVRSDGLTNERSNRIPLKVSRERRKRVSINYEN